VIGAAETAQSDLTQAAADGITHNERAREDGNSRRHTEDDGEVRTPVIREAAEGERRKSHALAVSTSVPFDIS
jgi:hypothetical protein